MAHSSAIQQADAGLELSSDVDITEVPEGLWHVDPQGSEVAFTARGAWGLQRVRGQFGAVDGVLVVDADSASGELYIQAASLDTGQEKRDAHLRSEDFFDAAAHPVITFSLLQLVAAAGGKLQMTGTLRIRDSELPITAPVQARRVAQDLLRLDTRVAVDRQAAGVGRSRMAMIRGKAHLAATINLVLS
jgi:polyisoprenoid-binding protein YceI